MSDAEKMFDVFGTALKQVFNPDLPDELETYGDLYALLFNVPNVDVFLIVDRRTPLPDEFTIKRENMGGQPVFSVMYDDISGICFRYLKVN